MIGNINISGVGQGVLGVLSDPPASPVPGGDYGIGPNATGAWAGHEGKVARADANQVTGWLMIDGIVLIYDTATQDLHDKPNGFWEKAPTRAGDPGPAGPTGPQGPAGQPGGGGGAVTLLDVDPGAQGLHEYVIDVTGAKRVRISGGRINTTGDAAVVLAASEDGTTFPTNMLYWWDASAGGLRQSAAEIPISSAGGGVKGFRLDLSGFGAGHLLEGQGSHWYYPVAKNIVVARLISGETKAIRISAGTGAGVFLPGGDPSPVTNLRVEAEY